MPKSGQRLMRPASGLRYCQERRSVNSAGSISLERRSLGRHFYTTTHNLDRQALNRLVYRTIILP